MRDYVLKHSLEDQRIISIRYLKDNKIIQRRIKVIKIQGDNIQAYCYLRKSIRNFKRDNILSAIMYIV